MGCDIHVAVEVRRKGVWRYYRPKDLCGWYAEVWADKTALDTFNTRMSGYPSHKPAQLGDRKNTWDRCKYRLPDFFSERNYAHFALLAGVRNEYGIVPIQVDRGLPDDISSEALGKMSDEHSAGWVSLADLKDYDYRQGQTVKGYLADAEFHKLCRGETPEQWVTQLWGGRTNMVMTPEQYARKFPSPIDLIGTVLSSATGLLVEATWQQDFYDWFKSLPEKWVPYLEKLVPKGGTDEDVRVVMDFDS